MINIFVNVYRFDNDTNVTKFKTLYEEEKYYEDLEQIAQYKKYTEIRKEQHKI